MAHNTMIMEKEEEKKTTNDDQQPQEASAGRNVGFPSSFSSSNVTIQLSQWCTESETVCLSVSLTGRWLDVLLLLLETKRSRTEGVYEYKLINP